eukprot:PhM_4_TR11903/c0_g1_i1/m.27178/K15289/SLC35F5; solute carrier family 35, member F5
MSSPSSSPSRRTQLIGTAIIFAVALLWTLASVLTQTILIGMQFNRPIMITVINASLFSLWFVPWIVFVARDANAKGLSVPPLREIGWAVKDTSVAAVSITPVWLLANILYNISLEQTSVASNTVLCNTSSLWTLLLGRAVVGTPITRVRATAVALAIGGAVLVALGDDATTAEVEGPPRSLVGDVLALGSAVFYAVYTILLQLLLPTSSDSDDDENENENVDLNPNSVLVLFGIMGCLTIALSPIILGAIHITGLETFSFPPKHVWLAFCANAVFGTVIPQLLWAKGVILTSPLVATLGLSLTIPLSMVADAVAYNVSYTPTYMTGCVLVAAGFVLCNLDSSTSSSSSPYDNDGNEANTSGDEEMERRSGNVA